MFPELLKNGIWHTTSVERFNAILKEGAILPEPPIPDSERWSTGQGPEWYPFVRKIGGVSVFDFTAFDEVTYENEYPLSNWSEFVPCREKWGSAAWIELKRESLGASFIDGRSLLVRWKKEGRGRRLMPLIEGAHIGPVPSSSFGQVFIYEDGQWKSAENVASRAPE
jgi:hypothetical protein